VAPKRALLLVRHRDERTGLATLDAAALYVVGVDIIRYFALLHVPIGCRNVFWLAARVKLHMLRSLCA
jgi:hypothetical protein